jgi:hypothetical protein
MMSKPTTQPIKPTPKPAPKVVPLATRIVAAAFAGLEQKISNIPLEPMYCLKFARRVVETALGLSDGGFYRLVTGVDSTPSAVELEHLLRKQKPSWVVTYAQAGDLVFWDRLPPEFGHVGIVVPYRGAFWVAQNTVIQHKGIDYPGALRLVKLSDMLKPSSIIRIGG